MTERHPPSEDGSRSGSHPSEAATAGGHLVCAYSPRWLSGPSHYEGLVATFSPDGDDDPPPPVASGGSPA